MSILPPLRTLLELLPLEDRVVPTTVTVEKVQDGVEGGADGLFRFTRTGDTTDPLVINVSVGGTAAWDADYTGLGETTTVVIDSGQTTADLVVDIENDSVTEPTEFVEVTILEDAAYTVGIPSSAAVSIIDNDLLPVAFDGWATTSVNGSVDVAVLDLATDLDGDALTVTAVTQGTNGSVVINPDGTVTYTPGTGFVGDSFTFTVEDEFGNEATGTITITVTEPLAPPTSLWTAADTPVNIDAADMAFDPDGDTLAVTAVTQGSNGNVVIETDGTITYTPNTSFTGQDSFTYTVEDPDGNEATHTITVTVGPTDPGALDDAVTTPVSTAVNVEVLDLAWQPAGGTLTVIDVTQGDHGTVVINVDGSVTYIPDTDFTGTDTFTYTVQDGSNQTAVGTITMTVGTPPPDEADEIVEDLEAIENEIENYDEDSAEAIADALPAIIGAINDYLDDATTLISTNNVDVLGVNKSSKEFGETVYGGYRALYPAYANLLDIEDALWTALKANKILIETLDALRNAN